MNDNTGLPLWKALTSDKDYVLVIDETHTLRFSGGINTEVKNKSDNCWNLYLYNAIDYDFSYYDIMEAGYLKSSNVWRLPLKDRDAGTYITVEILWVIPVNYDEVT